MGVFARLRERFPFIKFLVNAQKTVWYPILYATLCIIGGINDHTVYIPILWILVSLHLFSVFFADDNKVFLTHLCMIYFSIGCDTSGEVFYESKGEMLSYMSDEALKQIVVIGIVGVGSFIIRLIADGSIAAVFKQRRAFTFGILAMDIAFLLNGILSPTYDAINLAYGALLAMGFTVIYFLVIGMLEKSEDPVTYGCTVIVGTAYIALIEIMIVVYRLILEDKFILSYNETTVINKYYLALGWGVSTVIAAVFMLGIPAALYLAKNFRGSFFTYFSCVLFIIGAIVINARCAMIVGIITFVIGTAVSCIFGKNKKKIRIYALICLIAGISAVVYVHKNIIEIQEILKLLRIDALADSGRGELWKNGIEDFKKSPLFGAGFNDGGYAESLRNNNFYSNMYHCILIQIPGAMGILGCLAMLIHVKDLTCFFFKKFSADKMLLLLIPIMIIGMSMLDNFFFYLDIQILYGVSLALAEIQVNQKHSP